MTKKSLLKNKDNDFIEDWAAVLAAPFGKLGVKTTFTENSLFISEVLYVSQFEELISPKNALAQQFCEQAERYFNDPKFQFQLPTLIKGTSFQRTVWAFIDTIPQGTVVTYGHLAKKIGSAARAVGGACGANPYPMIVPCHRVVAHSGIGGFAKEDAEGYHRNIKTWLLKHEGIELP
ncbi:methylated-DNA--[protein]-cysteine S-methyltransferase [Polynucleobacter rarus]|jgi:methylated-DNA-[protein]-cysteine S-methyltransferase|uniref:methylated-DNA--[protein]-cysteine S-methyltransferase n=1 Tax=Polynucleobacter rarus TaxID=556055 RepID=UPI000D3E572B|nr:methylated-DNA--[protein]-cysteine S-methyltransferase [Polynucleobacter rarus]